MSSAAASKAKYPVDAGGENALGATSSLKAPRAGTVVSLEEKKRAPLPRMEDTAWRALLRAERGIVGGEFVAVSADTGTRRVLAEPRLFFTSRPQEQPPSGEQEPPVTVHLTPIANSAACNASPLESMGRGAVSVTGMESSPHCSPRAGGAAAATLKEPESACVPGDTEIETGARRGV
jgi:hypothetical protein